MYIYLFLYFAAPPVNTRALASLAPVSGDALHRHLPKILPALISALAESQGKVSFCQKFLHRVRYFQIKNIFPKK